MYYSFPVVVSNKGIDEHFKIDNIIGTAFSIGGGYFITCEHVIRQCLGYSSIGIGFPKEQVHDNVSYIVSAENKEYFENSANCEIISKTDIAIFRLNISIPENVKTLDWNRGFLQPLDNCLTHGYPFSLEIQHQHFNKRSFKGYIVSFTMHFDLPNPPYIYELSFPCPRGLSGAFLLDENNKIAGMIIGNRDREIEIYYGKEVLKDGSGVKTHLKTETMKLGIAITSYTLIQIESKLLGGKILSFLEAQKIKRKLDKLALEGKLDKNED